MATINLRNNTQFFIKVDGFDDIIVPNTIEDDRTFQFVSSDNKNITIYPTIECNTTPITTGNISFVDGTGLLVERGKIEGSQTVKLDSDITGTPRRIVQEFNEQGGKLLDWSDLTSDTVVNLSYFNIV